ncbi:LGFP repeat-containing protein [Nocardia sp. NPDC051570]|uniref:LGFP repeat-containing protein n=1 Tax=Nocardia sp. NPDC051570 TaxID=3364324 RepID=UPI0037BE1D7E
MPGKMRSDREKIPDGYTKADADKAETMEARIEKQRMLRAAPGCEVYWPAPFEVCGAIRDKYNSLGGPRSFLLLPKSNELTNPDGVGRRSEFQNGPIYWSPQGGAHPVVNHFFAAWARHGWEGGYIGYPTTDEIANPDRIGRRQHFTGSTIYWNARNPVNAYSIGGAIFGEWGRQKWEQGWLGYPTSDEEPADDKRYNSFENGYIFWAARSGAFAVRTTPDPRKPAHDGYCDANDPAHCSPDPNHDAYYYMQACMDGYMRDDDIVLVLKPVGELGAWGDLTLTCGRYRHIHNNHNAHADQSNFLLCLSLTYTWGLKWDGAKNGNSGIAWDNRKGHWGYIVYDLQNRIVTAFPSGDDGKDWGGCTRGYRK